MNDLRHKIRVHLANRYHYSHAEFCTKLEELMQESEPSIIPEDFLSHQASWRAALVQCEMNAPEPTHDMDDKAYWRHELAAFDRAYSDLAAPSPTMPFVPWSKEAEMWESWTAHSISPEK